MCSPMHPVLRSADLPGRERVVQRHVRVEHKVTQIPTCRLHRSGVHQVDSLVRRSA
jgi:hypothetical protein